MEDTGQGSRRSRPSPRPDSDSSGNTRMTPQTYSDGSSSTPLPQRSNPNSGARGRESGGANLLHERLRERKVESARQKRRSVDMTTYGERVVQSSPAPATKDRDERRPSSSGVVAGAIKKGMGVKQIEEQVSTLHKQNFDLKLELFHRRQRQESLEARLEAAEKQIAEQGDLQEVNEQLLAELENRDQAVEEAVSIIVSLEEKVARLMQEREGVRSFDGEYDSSYFRASHDSGLPSSPPILAEDGTQPTRFGSRSKGIPRMPSFLSEQSEGTEALRSLYLPTANHSYTDATLPKLPEDAATTDGMNSPRLSVLSESSFLSVYGGKNMSLDATDQDEADDSSPPRHRKSLSVEKWIEEPHAPTATPARANALKKGQYLSINNVLESPLQRLEKLKLTVEKKGSNHTLSRLQGHSNGAASVTEKQQSRKTLRHVFTDKSSFEHQHTLPPTPDTISTSTLRLYKNSNDALRQDQYPNEVNDPMLQTNVSRFRVPSATFNEHESTLSIRPRSAGETITSRRDGHGWDTETQEDMTEAGSVSSIASTFSALPLGGPQRVMTPNLFMFGGNINQDDHRRNWVQDVMFNNDPAAGPPTSISHRYETLRRSSFVEHPRSDETLTPNNKTIDKKYHGDDVQYSGSPLDTSPRPDLPDRRSSLSATMKLRKMSPANYAAASLSSHAPTPIDMKRSRLTSRFFGRSESCDTPASMVHQQQQPSGFHSFDMGSATHARPRGNGNAEQGRSMSFASGSAPRYGKSFGGAGGIRYEEEDHSRATPPPIRRSKTIQSASGGRPSSAGVGAGYGQENRFGRGFGADGSNDDASGHVNVIKRKSVDITAFAERSAVVEDGNNTGKVGGGRKWFGIGRNRSLRQT